MHYDQALITTGATPVMPSMQGRDLENVFTLRNRADADAILEQAERSTRAAVLGASFIGMQVGRLASRERGLDDDLVVGKERGRPSRSSSAGVSAKPSCRCTSDRGVTFRHGAVEITALGRVARRHRREACEPAKSIRCLTCWLPLRRDARDGLRSPSWCGDDGGIIVDETLRVAEGLYAAGDIAAFPYRDTRVCVEHWRVAQQHGRIAASTCSASNTVPRAPSLDDPVRSGWTISDTLRTGTMSLSRQSRSAGFHRVLRQAGRSRRRPAWVACVRRRSSNCSHARLDTEYAR